MTDLIMDMMTDVDMAMLLVEYIINDNAVNNFVYKMSRMANDKFVYNVSVGQYNDTHISYCTEILSEESYCRNDFHIKHQPNQILG